MPDRVTVPTPVEPEAEEVEIPSRGDVVVETSDQPPPAPPGKTIHPRRPLPDVPEAPNKR